MKIHIRGRQLEITPALQEYAERKLGRIQKYMEGEDEPQLFATLSVVRGEHKAEASFTIGGIFVRAEERSDDMYASIDMVEQKLERQMRKYKTRLKRKTKTSVPEGAYAADPWMDEDQDEALVRVKRFTMKPMDIDEAILQMNLLGHPFFVYRDSITGLMGVVYKRGDGTYGQIIPE